MRLVLEGGADDGLALDGAGVLFRRPMPKPGWSPFEDDTLGHHWGRRVPSWIARECNRRFGRRRTTRAVVERARKLGLPKYSDVIKSVWAFAKETGYSRSRVETAIKRLGIRPKRVGAMKRALTLDHQEKLLRFLATIPDGRKLTRATQGQWGGVGHNGNPKPEACRDCGRNTVPYFCKGRCRRCDWRWRTGKPPVSFSGAAERRLPEGSRPSPL